MTIRNTQQHVDQKSYGERFDRIFGDKEQDMGLVVDGDLKSLKESTPPIDFSRDVACFHIYGFEEDEDGTYLVDDKHDSNHCAVKFTYCPLCGEKL